MENLTPEENQAFEKAFDTALCMDKSSYPSYIGGLKIASGMEFESKSPIDDSIIFGRFQEPEKGLMDRAVEVAKEAFKTWSKTPVEKRIEIFSKFNEKLENQRFRFAAMVMLVSGMNRRESLDEVDALISVIDEACDTMEQVKGKPIGVWAVVSEYNSPLAAPIGHACTAMIAGNTVVLMPSKYTPLTCYAMYSLLEECGLPGGVLNLAVDKGMDTTVELTNNPDVDGIVATGSGERLEDMIFLQMNEDLHFINEIKGMNPIFLYKPANMREAVKMIIESAFSFGGQRVDSCSKVVVTMQDYKPFIEELLKQAKNINVNDPSEEDTFFGPLISMCKADDLNRTLDLIKANVIFGGKPVKKDMTQHGAYYTPVIVDGLDAEHDLNTMDPDLPILSIQIANDIEDAIDIINCSEYGLSVGIMTKEQAVVTKFLDEINADDIFINESSRTVGTASKAKVENYLK